MSVQVDAASGPLAAVLLAGVEVRVARDFLQMQVFNEVRRSVASGLGPWLTDDLVVAGLQALQLTGGNVHVWTDLVVLTACFQSKEIAARRVCPCLKVRLCLGHACWVATR